MYKKITFTNEFTACEKEASGTSTTHTKLSELSQKERHDYHYALRSEKNIDIKNIVPCKCAYIKSLGGNALCTPCSINLKRDSIKSTKKR